MTGDGAHDMTDVRGDESNLEMYEALVKLNPQNFLLDFCDTGALERSREDRVTYRLDIG